MAFLIGVPYWRSLLAFLIGASSLEWRRGTCTPALQNRPIHISHCLHAEPESRFVGTRVALSKVAVLALRRGRHKCAHCPNDI